MKTCIIMNPHSGGNRPHRRRAEQLRAWIDRDRLDATLHLTEGPGHATELAERAKARGYQRVVAIGGDGTLNETIVPLIGSGTTIGLVPQGSGDGLARHLGLPQSLSQAWKIATHEQPTIAALDTGTVNGRPFCNVMGIGFDAEVGRRFNRLERRGLASYARVTLQALRDLRPVECTITYGEKRETLEVLILAIANSSQYGNHAIIAPRAEPNDGLLDLVAIRHGSFLGTAALLPSLFLGNLHARRRVFYEQATRFSIERKLPGLVHTDGETVQMPARLEVEIRAASLQMIVPPGAASSARSTLN